jgi:hypothetical protein
MGPPDPITGKPSPVSNTPEAIGRLDRDPRIGGHRHVERARGLDDRAGAAIEVLDFLGRELARFEPGALQHQPVEADAVGAIAGGRSVRDVVRDRRLRRHLAAEPGERGIDQPIHSSVFLFAACCGC